MKRLLALAILAMLALACSKEDDAPKGAMQQTDGQKTVFYATMEGQGTPGTGTKVYADENLNLLWNENDSITIFNKRTLNVLYIFAGEDGDNSGEFEEVPYSGFATGNNLDHIYAVYPYAKGTKINNDGTNITLNLPSTQAYREHSFGVGANTMVAVTDDYFLGFKNVCGYLKFRFYGDDVNVKSITLEGNNGEKIAGKAVVSPVINGTPTVAMDETATESITLNCADPVTIGTSSTDYTEFIFAVPPTTFTGGFKVTVTTPEGGVFEKTSTRSLTISRNKMESMGAMKVTPEYDDTSDLFTITSIGATSVSIQKKGSPYEITLEYRKGTGSWAAYEINSVIELADGEFVQFRAGEDGNSNFSKNISSYYKVDAGGTGTIKASGNITSLLDRDCVRSDVPEYAYCRLFASCVKLVDASKLTFSATTLASNCYQRMFFGCTGLTSAPEVLPATTMADYCYSELFYGCTGLTTAPELPATTLACYCYQMMFYGCTALTSAPVLPAMALASNCYDQMFYGCTGLTTAPEQFPATKLASYCYNQMFYGCTALIAAPELPATALASYCYNQMFYGCSRLTVAPERLPATNLVEHCYYQMFHGCKELTTAPELPATSLTSYCYYEMFYGCTSLTAAPQLPATKLAKYCYQSMFYGCTALTAAPELPATTLATYCYKSMFSGCTSLTAAPELPATTLACDCYSLMFWCCTALTVAPELPATTLEDYCYCGMFSGCTALTVAPKLPATTILAGFCYSSMFKDCINLNYIKMLATDVDSSCLSNWVSGVASTGTFVKSSSATWDITGNSGIPTGWTVITE